MQKANVLLIFFFSLTLHLSSPITAEAFLLTTDMGQGADSFVRSDYNGNGEADVNYGSEPLVWIKHDVGLNGNNRKGYFRFDKTGITDPIISIAFELTYSNTDGVGFVPDANPSTYNVYGLNDGHAGENWGESNITWNNAPGNDTTSAGGVLGSDTTFLGSFDMSFPPTVPGSILSFSTPQLFSFFNADTDNLLTLILTRQQQNTSIEYFESKERIIAPAPALNLVTETTPPSGVVPEPATMLLFGSGMVGALARRKKKA